MHLSLLSDTTFELGRATRPAGRAHRDGVLRGLVFLAAISVPLALAVVTGHGHSADASRGYAVSFDVSR